MSPTSCTCPRIPIARTAEEAREGSAARVSARTIRTRTRAIREHLPDKRRIALADAQFVIAREYGFRELGRAEGRTSRVPPPRSTNPLHERVQTRARCRRCADSLRDLFARHPQRVRSSMRRCSRSTAPALVHFASAGERRARGRASASPARIRTGAATGGRADFTLCTWRSDAVAERLLARGRRRGRVRGGPPGPSRPARSDAPRGSRARARARRRRADAAPLRTFRDAVDLLLDRTARTSMRGTSITAHAGPVDAERERGGGRLRARASTWWSAAQPPTSSWPRRSGSPRGCARCSRPIRR